MKEFLLSNYSFLTKSVIAFAAITGLYFYRSYKNTVGVYFIWYLIAVFFMELIGFYPRYFRDWGIYYSIEGTLFQRNYWFYNLCWCIGSPLFFSFYYRQIISDSRYKKWIKIATWAFLAIILVYIVLDYNVFFEGFVNTINISGMTLIVCCITFYFLEVLRSDKILNFHKSLNFYISAIILLYFLVTQPLIFFDTYNSQSDIEYVHLKDLIRLTSNLLMYLSFSIALVWCNPQNK
ncbi:hypothetical protein [Formosa haliotis]|uniref:hypothetical protein n=1 Tax=Formosa haliotis TaxID=1555194 RepID=UPI000824CC59|nr:hypothetical protein [Formosa haliotis]